MQRKVPGSSSQGSPLQSAEPGDLLGQALDDAELLLAFAVQSNRSVDATLVAALIDAVAEIRCPTAAGPAEPAAADSAPAAGQRDVTDPCSVDSTQRKAFWKAYDDFALAMAPISAYTIRETRGYLEQSKTSLFFSSTFQLAIVSVAVFLAALVLQARWLEGKRIEDRLRSLDTAYEKQHAEFRTAFDRLCALTALDPLPRPVTGKAAAGVRAVALPVAPAPSGVEVLQRQQAQRQVWTGTHAREMIEQRQQRLLGEIDAWQSAVAYPLDHLFDYLLSLTRRASARATSAAAAPNAMATAATEPSPSAVIAAPLLCQAGPPLPAAVARLRAEGETKRMHFEAKLGLLETVFIPMLMGLLGASTYMLRLVVLQLKTSTFTPRFPSLSLVRLVLGMIIGVLGGSLLPVIGDGGGIKALPPLALPFVFGYAIEVLFAGLDKLVSSFTPDTGPAPAPR